MLPVQEADQAEQALHRDVDLEPPGRRPYVATDRSYRKAMPVAEAVAELRAGSGTQFDPVVVDALIAAVEGAELLQAA
jgi:hypothetical protein